MKYVMYYIQGGVKSAFDFITPCQKYREKIGHYPNLILVDDSVPPNIPSFLSLSTGEDCFWVLVERKPFVLTNHILVGYSNETIIPD